MPVTLARKLLPLFYFKTFNEWSFNKCIAFLYLYVFFVNVIYVILCIQFIFVVMLNFHIACNIFSDADCLQLFCMFINYIIIDSLLENKAHNLKHVRKVYICVHD